jgi:hypothetical protein
VALTTWILDDRPFGLLAQVVDEQRVSGWPGLLLLVADATVRALDSDRSLRRRSLYGCSDEASPFRRFAVAIDDPAADVLYKHLRKGHIDDGSLAEHEAVAWALVHEVEAVFVSCDQHAVLTALAELGRGRVAHPFDFWQYLRDAGLLSAAEFDSLCTKTLAADGALPGIPWRFGQLAYPDGQA